MKSLKDIVQNVFHKKNETQEEKRRRNIIATRAAAGIASDLSHGNSQSAFVRAAVAGIKLASGDIFKDPKTSPLHIYQSLNDAFGEDVWLEYTPEVLMSSIDMKFNGWTQDQGTKAIEMYLDKSILNTDVHPVIREKIYALRAVKNNPAVLLNWHLFEKVVSAFSSRKADFAFAQKPSLGECSAAVAIISKLTTDPIGPEVSDYIAAVALDEGYVTLAPSKFLNQFDDELEAIRKSMDLMIVPFSVVKQIEDTMKIIPTAKELKEDPVSLQAMRLFAVDAMGEEALQW